MNSHGHSFANRLKRRAVHSAYGVMSPGMRDVIGDGGGVTVVGRLVRCAQRRNEGALNVEGGAHRKAVATVACSDARWFANGLRRLAAGWVAMLTQ